MEDIKARRVDTQTSTDKKCPSCGGVMDFNPKTRGMSCPYCGYAESITLTPQEAQSARELAFEAAEHTGNCDWGMQKKRVICKSCGAESIYDALQIADECPYCGSNQVMEEKDEGTLAPSGVCPFRVDAKQAGQNFHSWIRRKWFCPRVAKQKAKPDAFHGVYLPYWTFDADTFSRYTGRYGIDREEEDSKGEKRTVTDWHGTSGTYRRFIDDELVLATEKQDIDMLRRIEPFDTTGNVAYKPEYMAGFASERYSIGLKAGWEKAKEYIGYRLHSDIEKKISDEHHADHAEVSTVETTYSNIAYKYLLLPVWVSSFRYNGKVYQFMVNGQNGKVGGKTPVSALRVTIAVILGIAVLACLFWLVNNS